MPAKNYHKKVVRELLNKGVSLNIIYSDCYNSFLGAAVNGRFEVVQELLNKGASVNFLSTYNETLLIAAGKGHLQVVGDFSMRALM